MKLTAYWTRYCTTSIIIPHKQTLLHCTTWPTQLQQLHHCCCVPLRGSQSQHGCLLSFTLMLALFSSRSHTTILCPCKAAKCSAVLPRVLLVGKPGANCLCYCFVVSATEISISDWKSLRGRHCTVLFRPSVQSHVTAEKKPAFKIRHNSKVKFSAFSETKNMFQWGSHR